MLAFDKALLLKLKLKVIDNKSKDAFNRKILELSYK